MMESKRRRVDSCAEEDRIGNLQEHLIDSILERLPVQDAVKTSILSNKWRYRWTAMRALVFDEHFSNKFAKNGAFGHNGLIRIINRILILHKGPVVKFHLHIPNMKLDSFQEVHQFILLLARNGIRELILTNLNRRYELSSYVFSCLQLTKLELKNCFLRLPLDFEGFPNLEELILDQIEFGANMCGTEIYLPQLKKLILNKCTNAYNINIKTTKLKTLVVVACPDTMLLRLLENPCLTEVAIAFPKPIEDSVPVKKMNLAGMLSNWPRIRKFSINSHFLKFLTAEKIPELLPRSINRLQLLRLSYFQLADLDQLYGAFYLLQNSPNLETLQLNMKAVSGVEVGPALYQLDTPNCLDCTLNQLQTVEMTYFGGSRPELLFVKLLLAHSPSLEKFTISASVLCDAKTILNIAKDVMQFPRASTKAKVIYLDPKP